MNARGDRCELCAAPLAQTHGHVVDVVDRRLLCACRACATLFFAPGSGSGRFKGVPSRYAAIPAPLFSDAQWDALGIPIGLAFFFRNGTNGQVVAFYPGPGGATESLLSLDAWNELTQREPLVADLAPDVEAVLVYRRRNGPTRAYVVPIDACYQLTGVVRAQWRGLSGGDGVETAIEEFFDRIEAVVA
jgi:hypothetical protein